MNFFYFKKPHKKGGENMPDNEIKEVTCHDKCYTKLNYCNDLVYTFGVNKGCRKQDEPLETTGGTQIGYAVNKAKLKDIKIVWSGEHDAFENLIITRNGEPVAEALIEGPNGTLCIESKEYFCDCDVINVISSAAGVQSHDDNSDIPGEWSPAGCITVSLWLEPKCTTKPHLEGDGIFEVYLSDLGTVTIPTTWSIVNMDVERINTIPSFVSWDGTKATLKSGVYKLDYAMTIETQTSTSLNFKGKLVIDGTDYPSSFSASHILAGSGGDVSLAQGVTLIVPHGQTMDIEVQAIVDVDSSTNGNADANLVIQRIANGLGL